MRLKTDAQHLEDSAGTLNAMSSPDVPRTVQSSRRCGDVVRQRYTFATQVTFALAPCRAADTRVCQVVTFPAALCRDRLHRQWFRPVCILLCLFQPLRIMFCRHFDRKLSQGKVEWRLREQR